MSIVNWLVSQSWPAFLPLWLGFLTLVGAPLVAVIRGRRPPEREVSEPKVVSDWDAHPHSCGCLCEGTTIYPCRRHKGQAARVLHPLRP